MIKHLLPAAALVIATAVTFDQPPARADNARWCAVISVGRGSAYWDCQYRTIEECVPHVLAGNRGFCNTNPAWNGVDERPKHRAKRHHRTQ